MLHSLPGPALRLLLVRSWAVSGALREDNLSPSVFPWQIKW